MSLALLATACVISELTSFTTGASSTISLISEFVEITKNKFYFFLQIPAKITVFLKYSGHYCPVYGNFKKGRVNKKSCLIV